MRRGAALTWLLFAGTVLPSVARDFSQAPTSPQPATGITAQPARPSQTPARDRARWTFGSRYVRSTRPDTAGSYSLRLVPTAGYRVVAVRGLESGQASDPEFLGRAIEDATEVPIVEGETRTLDLRVK